MTFLAHILAAFRGFDASIALMAQSSILVPYKTRIAQLLGAQLTTEAIWMPRGIHRLDHSPDHDLFTLVAVRSKEDAKVSLAVFAPLKLVEHSIREGSEALSAPKTL